MSAVADAVLKLPFPGVISWPSFSQNILSAPVKVQFRERGLPSVTFKSAGASVNCARTGRITTPRGGGEIIIVICKLWYKNQYGEVMKSGLPWEEE